MDVDSLVGGRYRLLEQLGEGGMGAVYAAIHTGTSARVAVKVLLAQGMSRDSIARFEREARAASIVDSRHIVRTFDAGTDEATGQPFLVMERLSGEDVNDAVERLGAIPPALAVEIGMQAGAGLAKAHANGVIHRDVKSANIFLHVDEGEIVVKVLDFGIARVRSDLLGQDNGRLTTTGSLIGSPTYMSPEQAQGLSSIDHRTDIWSLGVVLYEMLTGELPHGRLPTVGQVILAVCSKPPRPVRSVAPWVSPGLAAAVERALRLMPEDRYQTMPEMLDALRPFRRGATGFSPSEIRSVAPDERASSVAASEPSVFAMAATHGDLVADQQTSTFPNRKRVAIALSVSGLLLAVGVAGIIGAAQNRAHASPAPASSSITTIEGSSPVSAPAAPSSFVPPTPAPLATSTPAAPSSPGLPHTMSSAAQHASSKPTPVTSASAAPKAVPSGAAKPITRFDDP